MATDDNTQPSGEDKPPLQFGHEFDGLDAEAQAAICRLVEKTAEDGMARAEVLPDDRDIYCYTHPGGGIAWRLNGGPFGINQARGIARRH